MRNKGDSEVKEIMKKPAFYEEMLLLTAQELVAQLMKDQEISKADLARKLNKSKAHVTALLDDGRNMTLKTLANVCYHLNAEVKIEAQPLVKESFRDNSYDFDKGAAFEAAPPLSSDQILIH